MLRNMLWNIKLQWKSGWHKCKESESDDPGVTTKERVGNIR